MGLEYDPNDIEQYAVIASYQSTITYTQIYYLQQDGANIAQYTEDVPVHGRLKWVSHQSEALVSRWN